MSEEKKRFNLHLIEDRVPTDNKMMIAVIMACAFFFITLFGALNMSELKPTFNGNVDVAAVAADHSDYDLSDADGVAYVIVSKDLEVTNGSNVCYSVVFNFRGYDTMGESFILIAALAGCMCILQSSDKSEERKNKLIRKKGMGVIVRYGVNLLLPLACTFGGYVILHGDSSPGGGFQGGVLIASAVLLIFLAYGTKQLDNSFDLHFLHQFETFSEITYIVIGIFGIVTGLSFGTNFILKGIDLETAALMNQAVGIHVMCGVSFLLVMLLGLMEIREGK